MGCQVRTAKVAKVAKVVLLAKVVRLSHVAIEDSTLRHIAFF